MPPKFQHFIQIFEQYDGSPNQLMAIGFLLSNLAPDTLKDFLLLWSGKGSIKVSHSQSRADD